MAHDHHHGDSGAFYVEQLLTIGVRGLRRRRADALRGAGLAPKGSAVWMTFNRGVLKYMLAPKFHIWVFCRRPKPSRHGDSRCRGRLVLRGRSQSGAD